MYISEKKVPRASVLWPRARAQEDAGLRAHEESH